INPGSTSTKISVYEDTKEVFTKTLRHSNEELAPYKNVIDQLEFRKETIKAALKENNIDINTLAIIVGRGGLVKPIPSGVYEVNQAMIEDIRTGRNGEHASNLGAIIANELAQEVGGIKALIADPVVVDELEPVARISGHSAFPRISIFHALNQKAIAKLYAKDNGKEYKDLNIIVAHLGGGVSVGIHSKGRVIDVNDALRGEGPFSPERSGGLPAAAVVDACFSGKYTEKQIRKMISGEGGVVSYLGTNSFMDVENRVNAGDADAILINEAFAYQLAKEIGAMSTVVSGKVDAIIITGGIAYNKDLMEKVKEKVQFIAPVSVYPGEDEMGALAGNGLAVLEGTEEVKVY
ncbi:MAG: butyrate kinase, partial [Bacteroidales bacterium]|nr:butyrate kinase [Bacteroidales bacterium]